MDLTLEEKRHRDREKMRKWRAANPDHSRETGRKYYAKNAEKLRARAKQWRDDHLEDRLVAEARYREENRARRAEYQRDYVARVGRAPYRARYRLKRYGLTPAEYDAMLAEQEGCCAICGKTPSDRSLSVDHCHTTGKVRGLLCQKCNQALGFMSDDPDLLIGAALYLMTRDGKG